MRELGPRFERATGHKLAFFFGTTPELIKQATSGNPFDAGVVPQEVFRDTGAQAKFVAGPRRRSRASASASPSAPAPRSPTSARPTR